MDWRTFLILSKTRDYERMQLDRRREDYKKTKERILKYSLQNQVKYYMGHMMWVWVAETLVFKSTVRVSARFKIG